MSVSLPEHPPLELLRDGRRWTVERYRGGDRTGETLSTHKSRFDGLRAARTAMDERRYPCLLEWEADDNVREIFWNPLFETLALRHDELLDAWVVTPAESHAVLAANDAFEPAKEQAAAVQRRCHFRTLELYDEDGTLLDSRDHRFLRHRIADPDVRFDPAAVDAPPDADSTLAGDDPDGETGDDPPSRTGGGRLGVPVPDPAAVEVVTTEGVVHRFRTEWTDGRPAEVAALAPDAAGNERAVEAFETQLEGWLAVEADDRVASVHEWGLDPTPTVAFAAGSPLTEASPFELDVESRLGLLRRVVDAAAAWAETDCAGLGVDPRAVRLRDRAADADPDGNDAWVVSPGQSGLAWRVRESLGAEHPTPFVAPEQLDGETAPTTDVYQVAALAYWLLCERPPVEGSPLERAIATGQIRQPRLPWLPEAARSGAAAALLRGLDTDPSARHPTVTAFWRALYGACT